MYNVHKDVRRVGLPCIKSRHFIRVKDKRGAYQLQEV